MRKCQACQSQGDAEKRYKSVTKQLTGYKRYFGAKVLYCRHCYDNVLEVSKHRTEKEGSMALLEALNSAESLAVCGVCGVSRP